MSGWVSVNLDAYPCCVARTAEYLVAIRDPGFSDALWRTFGKRVQKILPLKLTSAPRMVENYISIILGSPTSFQPGFYEKNAMTAFIRLLEHFVKNRRRDFCAEGEKSTHTS